MQINGRDLPEPSQLQGLAAISDHQLPPSRSAVQGQDGGTLMWSVAAHWVRRLWVFPGSAGQDQPPPVFCLRPLCLRYKQPEMAAACAGLADSQEQSSCGSRLAVVSAGPGAS